MAIAGAAFLCLGTASEGTSPATLQDMRVAGRVLTFQDSRPSGSLTIAIPYAANDPASRTEADVIASVLGNGLSVGSLVLRPLVIPQDRLDTAGRYDAVFATAGLDNSVLRAALIEHRVPCLTLHQAQVAQGPCVIAIRSAPNVSITLSNANAALTGVRFATAFRMMVTEL